MIAFSAGLAGQYLLFAWMLIGTVGLNDAAHHRHLGQEQVPLRASQSAKKVAIIGAGAAGSSAAYFISQFAEEASFPVNLTVFEKSHHIGGRSTTVYAYGDNSSLPVELGASVFVDANQILVKAAKDLNLTVSSSDKAHEDNYDFETTLGIWDGVEFVWMQAIGRQFPGFWDYVRLFWRYGIAPKRAADLVQDVINRFLKIYEAPVFPFESIGDAALALDLTEVTAMTTLRLCQQNRIGIRFSSEIMQSLTRVNYAQNIDSIHGLEGMVSMAANGAMSVDAGNWHIFERMLQESGATVALNTRVSNVASTSGERAFTIRAENGGSLDEDFDEVVVAAPFHQANIGFWPPLDQVPDDIAYVRLHVTLLCSTIPLSGQAFGVDRAPDIVLTTLPDGQKPVAEPPFTSISLLRRIRNPASGNLDYLYKIFSRSDFPTQWDLEHLFQADTFSTITWIHRKTWLAYPVEVPRLDFEAAQLRKNLWYTSGMDSFISTMETNSLMGKNIARLIVDGWVDEPGFKQHV